MARPSRKHRRGSGANGSTSASGGGALQPDERRTRQRRTALHVLALALAALAAYGNSFAGVFLFDDQASINPTALLAVHGLRSCLESVRGVVACSLAFDGWRGGLVPYPFHVTNLAIHFVVACLVYFYLRRVLASRAVMLSLPTAGNVAAITALLWVVHPLTTEAVTYVIQRAESLVALFYVATLYAAHRAATDRPAWGVAAIGCCLLGMCTKPVMATAPIAVLLVDAVLIAGSVRGALRARPALYAALAATWAWLFVLLDQGRQLVTTGAGGTGFASKEAGVTPVRYLLSQGGVLLDYLRLALLPYPLCLDHHRKAAMGVAALAPSAVIAALVVYGLWALWRGRAVGLLVTLFFLILAPTSSVMPIADLEVEHRMYLPLVLVLLALVLLGERWRARAPRAVAAGAILVGLTWIGLTRLRNEDYRSETRMFTQVLEVSPENERAHVNLGNALSSEGRTGLAIGHYERALEINPAYAEAAGYLAAAHVQGGDRVRARTILESGLVHAPQNAQLYFALAAIDLLDGDRPSARAHLERSVALNPDFAVAHADLGQLYLAEGLRERAIAAYREVLRLAPRDAAARAGLARALATPTEDGARIAP